MLKKTTAKPDPDCGYGGPRDLEEQRILEEWRMQHGIGRPLSDLEIAVALAEAELK